MASTVIAAILNLKDEMSGKLAKVGKNWDNLSAKEQKAAKTAIATINSLQKKANKYIDTVKGIATRAEIGTAIAGITLGFKEAFSLEKYRSQLETATKDTKKAASVMQYAINLANKTPYEGGDMVAASAALEMASLSAKEYLTVLGDTAAGTNKSISEIQTQFVKAFATGQTADFFQSISVSKKSFDDFCKSNKLATSSIQGTQKALKLFLEERFGGGMQKLATTTAGAWSTVTGITKSALAQLVGMGTDGTVRFGSALDILRTKAQDLANKLVDWQESGELEKYTTNIGNALSTAFDAGEGLVTTLYRFRGSIAVIAGLSAGVWALTKAIAAYKTITEAARIAQMLLNGTIALSPVGLVLGAVGLAAGTVAAAYTASKDNPEKIGTGSFSNGAQALLSKTPAYANGTQYHSGGVAIVGERGPELISLPVGTSVTRSDSMRRLGNTVNNITVNISGANRTDDEVADMVARRIVEALDNV